MIKATTRKDMYIQKGTATRLLKALKLLFRKITSVCFCWQKPCSSSDFLLARYEFQCDISFEDYLPYAETRIELLHMLGYQVTVEQSNLQIGSEYIGRVSYWNGEKLLYQEYLQMQVEHIEKKKLVYLRLQS